MINLQSRMRNHHSDRVILFRQQLRADLPLRAIAFELGDFFADEAKRMADTDLAAALVEVAAQLQLRG